MFMWLLSWQCKTAAATMYVTRAALQRRYPPNRDAPTTNYTDLVLATESFVEAPRLQESFNNREPTLLNVGMMAQKYKGQDDLLRAARICLDRGIPIRVRFVGDGVYRGEFEQLAQSLGLAELCTFLGKLPGGDAIRNEIDRSDIFVLPSRQEGLPRALMEAMARAAPCIATTVGGNAELLDAQDLVPPDNPEALADAICAALSEERGLERRSSRNLNHAQSYRFDEIKKRRFAFYNTITDIARGAR